MNSLDMVGDKVISVSNALKGDQVNVGTLLRWDKIHDQEFPIVEFEDGEKLCFTVLFPYTEEFYNFLITLKKPYEFACSVSMAIQIRTRKGMGK